MYNKNYEPQHLEYNIEEHLHVEYADKRVKYHLCILYRNHQTPCMNLVYGEFYGLHAFCELILVNDYWQVYERKS
jgi:hypothetical protein